MYYPCSKYQLIVIVSMGRDYWLFLFSCICIFWFSYGEYVLPVQCFKTLKTTNGFLKTAGRMFREETTVGSKADCGEGSSTFEYRIVEWWEAEPGKGNWLHNAQDLGTRPRKLQLDLEGRGASNWVSGLSGASGVFPVIWLHQNFYNLGLSSQW